MANGNADIPLEDPDPDIVDEDLELVGKVPWLYHPLRAFLVEKIIAGQIPINYKLMRPRDVWETFCDNDVFEGFEYDAAFTRRLLSLRKLVDEGKKRADKDLEAFNIARQNHPAPEQNHCGEPQWNGSEAQRLLKKDIDNNLHQTYWPGHLHASKPAYQEFSLDTFRDHIYQEVQTRKYLYTLKFRAKEKEKERKEKARKKALAAREKEKRDEEKAVRDAENEVEKERKAAEQEAAKQAKAAEKQTEKERKAAEREAAKQAKAAERQAEKERKAAEREVAKQAKAAKKQAEKEQAAATKKAAAKAAKEANAADKKKGK